MTGPTCPACGTPDAQTIVYGLAIAPPPDGYVTGGCVVSPDGDDPTHECPGRGGTTSEPRSDPRCAIELDP